MAACPSCGTENPDGFNFCGRCATPLTVPTRGAGEERKIVTALFCDLVDFTAVSESADPEDVAAMLTAYFAMARTQIEAHGGVVEKFIGDAVLGVFGVPAAHEDDPERAVRAGLRIAEGAEDLAAVTGEPLQLRIGINTGEALVRLGVVPGSGERFLAGDAINTASRIQSSAPPMCVAVGLTTYDATRVVFDYDELAPATVKGKVEPVRVFHAKSSTARFGTDLTGRFDSPFIGREVDLALLKGIFDKAVAAAAPQLVSVVGEPGLGKSRLVAELFRYVDGQPVLVTWRQGRCLPYGEGITFWALGEILKAHTGILESDPPEVATSKLEVALPDGSERAWFRQRLLPLLGIEATSIADRDELFSAWRRFFEQVAEADPTVLVFEDLHWADPAMLAFIEHLADRAQEVPLLIVGTARPELFDNQPDYGRRLRNATPINLTPLSTQETARLVSALLETSVIPAELQGPILERAGGNPLFAEEYVRLLRDKKLLTWNGSSWELASGADIPFPDSVQALIAARLDALPAGRKAMLADAAVVGKVFWAGAVATMADLDEGEVNDAMRELSRAELIRPARRSSMEGQTEYAFRHVLAHDVAYNQLPRSARALRHVAAATWLESQASGRVEDLADVLAYHYATALELARAADSSEQVAQLQPSALRFLTLAGERALGLDIAAAHSNFVRALALTPPGHPGRAEALALLGEAAFHGGLLAEAEQSLDKALALFGERGDVLATARTMRVLEQVLHARGDDRWVEMTQEAVTLLEALPPGQELVGAYTELSRVEALHFCRNESAIRYANQALDLAARLGVDRPARALGYRGLARSMLGDASGLADYRAGLALASEAGQVREVAVLHNNLAMSVWVFTGPAAALDVQQAGISIAVASGHTEIADANRASTLDLLIDMGQLLLAHDTAADLEPRLEANGDIFNLISVRAAQARLMALHGDPDWSVASLDWLTSAARSTGDPQAAVLGVGSAALAHARLGNHGLVARLLAEIVETPGSGNTANFATLLAPWVRAALAAAQTSLAQRLMAEVQPRWPYSDHALVSSNAALAESNANMEAAADGYADAACRWQQFGIVPEEGFAMLGQGRCLMALGRTAEATPVLRRARDLLHGVGAFAGADLGTGI